MSTSTSSSTAKRKLEPAISLPEPQNPSTKPDLPPTTSTRPATSPSAVALAPVTAINPPPRPSTPTPAAPVTPTGKKRRASGQPDTASTPPATESNSATGTTSTPVVKKSRTNTPWTPAEEQRLKQMRDVGNSWSEIAKTFPSRTEGSVKKHWYKDMHYAEFAEDESAALLAAIKEYESNKWKVIGQKVGKPAKACEQYAKEHFGGRL